MIVKLNWVKTGKVQMLQHLPVVLDMVIFEQQ
jgi:hypothetical protein